MNSQSFSKIWIVIVLVILISGGILTYRYIKPLIIEEGGEEGGGDIGMPILDALPVFYSNLTITSAEEVLAFFNQNFDKIVENTKEELTKYGKSQEVEVIDEMVFFNDYIAAEKREWKNDQYWLLPPDKSTYVLITPAVSQGEKWEKRDTKIFVERTKCKGLQLEQGITIPVGIETYEDLKKYFIENCSKYPIGNETEKGAEIYWIKTELWIKYLVDDNGVIYWAGEYLRTKPWFGY